MISCHCLNIIIETETNDFDAVSKDVLTELEAKDMFFKQDVQQIRNLIGINKACNSLVYHRVVGSWQVIKCINCNLETHAIHQSKGAAGVIISNKLYNLADINKLKASEQRSEIFNIIVKSQQNDEEHGNDYVPAEVQQSLASLRQQMNEVLTRFNIAVEERVRDYTEQQYAALEDIKERALREHRALTRLIIGNGRANTKPIGVVTEKVSAPKSDMSSTAASALPDVKTAPMAVTKPRTVFSPKPKAVHAPHVSMSSENGASFDSEGLFSLEDMDDIEPDGNANVYDDSDNEDTFREDGVGIEIHPRQRLSSQSILAKSLPVDIPVFMAPPQNHNDDEQEDIVPHTEDPMDIAASIRALARSVHGDTVFGDLPRPTRPRFTTNI